MYGSRERTTVSRDATALPTPAQPRRISCRNMWRATSLPYRDRFTDETSERSHLVTFSSGRRRSARARTRAAAQTDTRNFALDMPTQLRCLLLLCGAVAVTSTPSPGRIPKVYNALITSNQNLEPSKAYPVYQPVIHDATFTFPLQSPFFYNGELPLGNTFIPAPAFLPKEPDAKPEPARPASSTEAPVAEDAPSMEQPSQTPGPSTPEPESASPQEPPTPPSTESPIPLNEFGLPPQVLPISRTYNSIPSIGHFTYSYPSIRFYDPFEPFGFHPYAGLPPLYHPLTNILGQYDAPQLAKQEAAPAPAPTSQPTSTPPPEPNDLNVLNYSPKDPEIANVPPPPLPQGGLKPDKSE
ncbi:unnamed protein product, partial [Iphiclides podalirius]